MPDSSTDSPSDSEPDFLRCALVTGGTGFIGTALVARLLGSGYKVFVLTRNLSSDLTHSRRPGLNFITSLDEISKTETIAAVINFAGEPLAASRWSAVRKQTFIDSRVRITADLFALIERLHVKPEVLVSGSAIGWYGPLQDELLDEGAQATPCYSHELCELWEQEARRIKSLGVRVCLLRIGIVLGASGGPLLELRKSFSFKVAVALGHGRQWMSWIHLHDLVEMTLFLLDTKHLEGPVNGTAPEPVTNSMFTDALAEQLKPWLRIRVPGRLLSLLVGEMAEEVLLTGQRVIPEKATSAGFIFEYTQIRSALRHILCETKS